MAIRATESITFNENIRLFKGNHKFFSHHDYWLCGRKKVKSFFYFNPKFKWKPYKSLIRVIEVDIFLFCRMPSKIRIIPKTSVHNLFRSIWWFLLFIKQTMDLVMDMHDGQKVDIAIFRIRFIEVALWAHTVPFICLPTLKFFFPSRQSASNRPTRTPTSNMKKGKWKKETKWWWWEVSVICAMYSEYVKSCTMPVCFK